MSEICKIRMYITLLVARITKHARMGSKYMCHPDCGYKYSCSNTETDRF